MSYKGNIQYSDWPQCDQCQEVGYDYLHIETDGTLMALCKECYRDRVRIKDSADEAKELKEWLSNRPSATMDCNYEKVIEVRARLRELSCKRRGERLPSKMMEAQQMDEDNA
jgi:hypothetical protein